MVASMTESPRAQKASLMTRLRYRFIPDHLVGELLAKPWIDSSIPAIFLAVVLVAFYILTPNFFSVYGLQSLGRLLGEFAFVAIGQAIVVIGGGIDLSIGAVFALCNFIALALIFKFKLHVLLVLPITILLGAAVGSINGVLIGYLRLRAFLTTLVVLIIVRAISDLLGVNYGVGLVSDFEINGEDIFYFISSGTILGVPTSLVAALALAVFAHIMLTRLRLGWHILAVGGSRRSAYNASINVKRTVFLTYVISGALVGTAAYFYAVRSNSAATSTGLGMELNVILGTVLGGISLGGGRGSVMKALFGATVVLCINNGMLRLNLPTGGSSMVLGLFLLFAVLFDIYWSNNRLRILGLAYVSPTLVDMAPPPAIASGSVYAPGDQIAAARSIGKGVASGPGDVVIDDQGNLITGTSKGDILRFYGPDFARHDVLARTGGRPLGIQIDRDGALLVCVAGIGLYRVGMDGTAKALTVQTRRSVSIVDDSRIRMASGLDVAPDGKVYFTDSTIRYEAGDWMNDALEGRGNGRLLCYDPVTQSTTTVARNLVFANGVCLSNDGQSVLIGETWAGRISRYWLTGPRKGKVDPLVPNLPGYPGRICRASDGTYWASMVGMRSPVFDLALSMPSFRRRMIGRLGTDNWLFPNTNAGCVIKFDDKGQVLKSLWDSAEGQYPQITSVREHMGKLYLTGINNDKIGCLDLPDADPTWTGTAARRN